MTEARIRRWTARQEMELGNVFPDRPMQSGLAFVPGKVETDGVHLNWGRDGARYVQPKDGMLTAFLRLSDASDQEIAAYARRWGVLGLCTHGLPCSHNQYLFGFDDGIGFCLPVILPRSQGSPFWFQEPLELWRAWSRKAQALLNIAVQLNQGNRALWEDWNVIKEIRTSGLTDSKGIPAEARRLAWMKDITSERKEMSEELDTWISRGQVRPRASWNTSATHSRTPVAWRFSPDTVSRGPNLFGLLALNIVHTIAGSGSAVCSACARSYPRDRRPDPGRRNYCEECRAKGMPERDAAREYRARKK
jgi:hypothetical protein